MAYMGTWEVHIGFLWKEPRKTDCFKDTDGMIILKRIFKNWDGEGGGRGGME